MGFTQQHLSEMQHTCDTQKVRLDHLTTFP